MTSRVKHRAPTAALAVAGLVAALGLAVDTPTAQAAPAVRASAPRAGLAPAIVSLGDSAISGEGAGTDTGDGYFAGTDGPANYCHRHPQSEIFDTGLSGMTAVDLACSGAQTGDLVSDPALAAITGGGFGDFGEPKQDVQLARTAAQYDVKMVVVTIGANDDLDFSGIMESCLGQYFPIPKGTGCRDTIGSAAISQRVAKVIPKVTAAITDVRDTMRAAGYADGSYQLVYQSYFTPITPDIRSNDYATKIAQGCPAYPEDMAWGHNWVVPTFDDGLRRAAEAVPGVRFLDQRRVSYGHEVCAEFTTSPYEYTNGDVIDLSENTRNGCDYSIGILSLCENEIRQSYHLRVAGYRGEGNCLAEFYDQPAQQEAYCTLDQGDGTAIVPLTPGQPFDDQPQDGSWFQLSNAAGGQVLDLAGGGSYGDSTNGRLAITYPADGGLNQSFVLEAKPGGAYELDFSGNRNMCLDATAAGTTPGTRLEQWGCNGGGNQHWLVEPVGNGSYKLADSQNPTEVATLSGDKDSLGNPIVELAADNGSAAQQWQLTKLGIVHL